MDRHARARHAANFPMTLVAHDIFPGKDSPAPARSCVFDRFLVLNLDGGFTGNLSSLRTVIFRAMMQVGGLGAASLLEDVRLGSFELSAAAWDRSCSRVSFDLPGYAT